MNCSHYYFSYFPLAVFVWSRDILESAAFVKELVLYAHLDCMCAMFSAHNFINTERLVLCRWPQSPLFLILLLAPFPPHFYQLSGPCAHLKLRSLALYFKEDIQMANRHMERCSPSLIIREIKTILWYHLTPGRKTNIKKSTNNKWERIWRKGNLPVDGNVHWFSPCGVQFLKKLKIELPLIWKR